MTAGLSESSFGPIQKVRQVKYVYRYFGGCGNWGILALKILHLKICWRISFQIWYPLFPRTSLVLLFPMFNVWIIYENNHDVVRYSIYSKNSKLFMGKLEKNIISLRLELYNCWHSPATHLVDLLPYKKWSSILPRVLYYLYIYYDFVLLENEWAETG